MGKSHDATLIYGIAVPSLDDEPYGAVDYSYKKGEKYEPLTLVFTGYDFNGPTIIGYKATEINSSTLESFDDLPNLEKIDKSILIDFCKEFGFDHENIKWHLCSAYD